MSSAASSEAPPPANGDAVPAAQHHQHPLWQRAAGGGRGGAGAGGRGRGRGAGAGGVAGAASCTDGALPAGQASRRVPISMVELEIRARNEFDGGSTVASDEEHDEGGARHGRKRRRNRKSRSHEMGNRDSDDSQEEEEEEAEDEPPEGAGGDSSNEDGGEEGGEHADLFNSEFPTKRGKNKKSAARKKRADYRPSAAAAAAAAFGGGGAGSVQGSTALSLVSDTDDSASIASSQVRAAQKRSFPVSGVTCVGCVLPLRVTPVDDFVCGSADKMTEMALYKMAALVYKTKVADPADREEVPVPEWHVRRTII
mgnify:CR=1 FL=1